MKHFLLALFSFLFLSSFLANGQDANPITNDDDKNPNADRRDVGLRVLRELHGRCSDLLNKTETEFKRINDSKMVIKRMVSDFEIQFSSLKTHAETLINKLVPGEQTEALMLAFSNSVESVTKKVRAASNLALKWTNFTDEDLKEQYDYMILQMRKVLKKIASMIKQVEKQNSKLEHKAIQFGIKFESNWILWERDIKRLNLQVVELEHATTKMTVELDANDNVKILRRVMAEQIQEMRDDVDCFEALASKQNASSAYGTLEEVLKDVMSEAPSFNLSTHDRMDLLYNDDADFEALSLKMKNSSELFSLKKTPWNYEEVLAKLPEHNVTMQELLYSTVFSNDSTRAMITAGEIYARRCVLKQLMEMHESSDTFEWYKCGTIGTIKQELANKTRVSLILVKETHDFTATLHSHPSMENGSLSWTKYQRAARTVGDFSIDMVQYATLCSYLSKLATSLDETKDHSTLCLYNHVLDWKQSSVLNRTRKNASKVDDYGGVQFKFGSVLTLCKAFLETRINEKLGFYTSLTTSWRFISSMSIVLLIIVYLYWFVEGANYTSNIHVSDRTYVQTPISWILSLLICVLVTPSVPLSVPYRLWIVCVMRFFKLVSFARSEWVSKDCRQTSLGVVLPLISMAIVSFFDTLHEVQGDSFSVIANIIVSIMYVLVFIYHRFFSAASKPSMAMTVLPGTKFHIWYLIPLVVMALLLVPATHVLAVVGWWIYRKYKNDPAMKRNGNTNKNTKLVFDSDGDGSKDHSSNVLLSDAASSSKMVSKISNEPLIQQIDASSAFSSGGLVAGALLAIVPIFLLIVA